MATKARRLANLRNKQIGRRTGKDFHAGKKIRRREDGLENFDDYMSESEADMTREVTMMQTVKEGSDSQEEMKENAISASQSAPNSTMSTTASNFTASQSQLSQGVGNRSRFGWLRSKNSGIGRRTGKNVLANKKVTRNEMGLENFDDYMSESDVSSFSSRLSVSSATALRNKLENVHDDLHSQHSQESQNSFTTQKSDDARSIEGRQSTGEHSSQESGNTLTVNDLEHTRPLESSRPRYTRKSPRKSSNSHTADDSGKLRKSSVPDSISVTEAGNHSLDHSRHKSEISDNSRLAAGRKSAAHESVGHENHTRKALDYLRQSSRNSSLHHDNNDTKPVKSLNKSQVHRKSSVPVTNLKTDKEHSSLAQSRQESMRRSMVNEQNSEDDSADETSEQFSSVHGTGDQDGDQESHNANDRSKNMLRKSSSHSQEITDENGDEVSDDEVSDEDAGDMDDYGEEEKEISEVSDNDDVGEHSDNDNVDENSDNNDMGEHSDNVNVGEHIDNDDVGEHSDNDDANEHSDNDDVDEHGDNDNVGEDYVDGSVEGHSDEGEQETDNTVENKSVRNINNKSQNKSWLSTLKSQSSKTKSKISSTSQSNISEKSKTSVSVTVHRSEHDSDPDDVSGPEDNYDNESIDDENMRSSQAQSNIDVAGNRSGSITKLDIPTSVVSFNRTKKRLSYSAVEASEESIKMRKSRIEQANADLTRAENTNTSMKSNKTDQPKTSIASKQSVMKSNKTDQSKTSIATDQSAIKANKTDQSKTSIASDKSANNKASTSEIKPSQNDHTQKTGGEDGEESEFLSLASRPRSIILSTSKYGKESDIDTDDDIMIIEETKNTFNLTKQNKSLKSKSKAVSKRNKKAEKTEKRKARSSKAGIKGMAIDEVDYDDDSVYNIDRSDEFEVVKNVSIGEKTAKLLTTNTEDQISNSDKDSDEIDDIKQNTGEKSKQKRKIASKKSTTKDTSVKGKTKKHVDTIGDFDNDMCGNTDQMSDNDDSEYKIRKRRLSFNNADDAIDKGDSGSQSEPEGDKKTVPAKKRKSTTSSEDNDLTLKNQSKMEMGSVLARKRKSSSEDEVATNKNKSKLGSKTGSSKKQQSTIDNTGKTIIDENKSKSGRKHVSLKQQKSTTKKRKSDEKGDEHESVTTKKPCKHEKRDKKKSSKGKMTKTSVGHEGDNESENSDKTNTYSNMTTKTHSAKVDKTLSGKLKKSKSRKTKSESHEGGDNQLTNVLGVSPSTPLAESNTTVPFHYGSGVSFRVAQRSELLENMGSGCFTNRTVDVVMEPVSGMTPCIAKPGAARRSKGRRVTICPEENMEHTIEKFPDEDTPISAVNRFRHSLGLSASSTPLPHPDSTPMHVFETTNTNSPAPTPDVDTSAIITSNLIFPEPVPDGLRRSKRTRIRPVQWYKNERVVIDHTREGGPAIVGVKPSLEVKWNQLEARKQKKRKLRWEIRKAARKLQTASHRSRRLSIHTSLPADLDVLDEPDSKIDVINPYTGEEDTLECIAKGNSFKPVGPGHESAKKEDPYLITQHLDHPCMSTGKLCIKAHGEKPTQMNISTYAVFNIEYGKLLVTIHETTTLLETGDTFMVPIGNTYSIKNLRSDNALLMYMINKKTGDTFTENSIDPHCPPADNNLL